MNARIKKGRRKEKEIRKRKKFAYKRGTSKTKEGMRNGLMRTNRFYYTDERFEDGGSVFVDIDAQAHAGFYYELVCRKDQGPWEATFVKGKGYVDFDGKVALAPPFWRGEQT